MRLFESSQNPIFRVVNFDLNPNFNTPPGLTENVLFPAPRLGRVWSVQRFNIQPLEIIKSAIVTASPQIVNYFAITYTVFLNDVAVSESTSNVYQFLENNPENTDLAPQNGPLTITPYNQFEVRSGDLIKMKVDYGLKYPLPASFGHEGFQCKIYLKLIGENDPA